MSDVDMGDIMDDIRGFFSKLGDFLGLGPKSELSDFQKKKLLHEFHTFYGKCHLHI